MRSLITSCLVVVVVVATASLTQAQIRAPYGSGTGVNSLGIKTDQEPRVTRNYTIRQPGYYSYGYQSNYYGYGPTFGSGFGPVYGYRSYACPYCGRWGCRGYCIRGPVYLPAVVGDAGLLYGPRAAQRFLLGDPALRVVVPNVVVNNNVPVAPAAAPAANPIAPAPPIDPVPNREARARAWRLIEVGDRNFREGDFRDALSRYRNSTEIAKEMADGYFRTAFAMLAFDRWTEATLSIERGLVRKPDWPRSGFVLEELFATPEAKREAFRKLQVAKRESPHNADVRFMLGVMLHFDGQAEAAEAEFQRVIELTGRGNHAQAFLPPPVEEAEEVVVAPVPPQEE